MDTLGYAFCLIVCPGALVAFYIWLLARKKRLEERYPYLSFDPYPTSAIKGKSVTDSPSKKKTMIEKQKPPAIYRSTYNYGPTMRLAILKPPMMDAILGECYPDPVLSAPDYYEYHLEEYKTNPSTWIYVLVGKVSP